MRYIDISSIKLPPKLIFGILLVLLFIQQFFIFPRLSRLGLALNNALHVPLFFILTLLIWQIVIHYRNYPFWKVLVVSAIASTGLGLITEFVQFFTGRDASLGDFGLDLLGIASALLLLLAFHTGNKKPVLFFTSVFLAALLFLSGFSRVGYIAWLYNQRQEIAPQLLDFNGPARLLESSLRGDWEIIAGSNINGAGISGSMVKIRLGTDRPYPGIRIREPLPDWNSYQNLVLETYLAVAEPIPVTFRVETSRDRGMDSTVETSIEPGLHRQTIPINALIREEEGNFPLVRALLIFTTDNRQEKEFYLSDIRLE